jgi:pimeloyl-ACP methyl ester carboxylesterase
MRDSLVTLTDGRELAYTDIGETDWPCVVLFGGAPTSRLRTAYLEAEFRAAEIRVVSPERPGYGKSSPQPGRSMADWPSDFAALADALGLERCVVAGHSSGGPYAVACAALLKDRVSAGIVLAGVTDMDWPAAWDGYNEMEAHLMRINDEDAAVTWCVERFGEDGGGFFAAADFKLAEPDEAFFTDERIASMLAPARAEAFRQGVIGYAHDIVVQGRPWPFDPGVIAVPFQVIHGDSDLVVPLAHSRHNAELIPGSNLRVLPRHGHFTILAELPHVAASLLHSSV